MKTENQITQNKSDSSIEITRNTKGWTYSVKAYGSDNQEIRSTLNDLVQIAKAKVKELEAAEECARVV